jgi:hypothetical protein
MLDVQTRRIEVGARISPRELEAITGERVPIPDPSGLVHLQLRRFAGCPVCNLHLASIVRRKDELEELGIREVVVFHSSAADLRKYGTDVPLAIVADPDKRLYLELGAEVSVRALLDPRAWCTIVEAIARTAFASFRGGKLPPFVPGGGRYGLPADFLIDAGGRVIARRYGEHADDQWSVDELLAHARAHRSLPVEGHAPLAFASTRA